MENRLAENIIALREKNNLSKAKFGELINVSRQAVHSYETGIAKPSLDTLIRMSKIFDCSLDSLIYSEEKDLVNEIEKNEKISELKNSASIALNELKDFKEYLMKQSDILDKSISEAEEIIERLENALKDGE